MKPYAIYMFEQLPEAQTRYILREHYGTEIENFPAVWRQKTHQHCGEKYIVFRKTQTQRTRQRFTHALSLAENRMVTGIRFTAEFPQKAWGDFADDAILIEFNEDWTVLTLLFFKGLGKQSYSLFERWTAGELVETVETDILSIPA